MIGVRICRRTRLKRATFIRRLKRKPHSLMRCVAYLDVYVGKQSDVG